MIYKIIKPNLGILFVCQPLYVHNIKVHLGECIMLKPTEETGKIVNISEVMGVEIEPPQNEGFVDQD
jgi:hypothetical protein